MTAGVEVAGGPSLVKKRRQKTPCPGKVLDQTSVCCVDRRSTQPPPQKIRGDLAETPTRAKHSPEHPPEHPEHPPAPPRAPPKAPRAPPSTSQSTPQSTQAPQKAPKKALFSAKKALFRALFGSRGFGGDPGEALPFTGVGGGCLKSTSGTAKGLGEGGGGAASGSGLPCSGELEHRRGGLKKIPKIQMPLLCVCVSVCLCPCQRRGHITSKVW